MENSISSDLIRGHIDTIILRTVAEIDKNSQEISDEIAEKSDGKYELKQATLYSSLKRLESENYLKSYWKDSDNGRRKYFHLTEKGLALMNRNLSDWEFSRAIIDTLVDAKPSVVAFTTTQAVSTTEISKDPIQNLINSDAPVENNLKNDNLVNVDATFEAKTAPISTEIKQVEVEPVQNEVKEEVSKEVNFRNILNGLIKSQEPIKDTESEADKNPAIVSQNVIEKPEQVDFSTQIKTLNTVKDGKIDFSDIIDDCAKDNIKVKISQKNTAGTSAGIKINTVTMISAIMIFALFALELVLFKVSYDFLSNKFLLLILACAIFPIIMVLRAIKNPAKVVYRYLSVKNVLLMAFIVFFDLALLNVAVVFLVGADLTVKATLVKTVLIPLTFYLNSFLYFVIRSIFISGDMFKVVKK